MGNLGFAARDPIFFAHHSNIDKLWSNWNSVGRRCRLAGDGLPDSERPVFLNLRLVLL